MSVGPMEIIIVLALALLIFGPKRLPEMGRTLGRAAREFRKATDEVKGVLDIGLNDDDDAGDVKVSAAATAAPPDTPGREPWRDQALAATNPPALAPAAEDRGAPSLPGLAGFLGVAAGAPEPPAAAASEDESAAPAYASFLGASAARTDVETEAAEPEAAPTPASAAAAVLDAATPPESPAAEAG